MGKHKVAFFDTTDIDRQSLERLVLDVHELEGTYYVTELNEQTAAKAKDSEIVSIFITSKISTETLAKLPSLKLIALRSTGYNNIDVGAASGKEIVTCNVPTYGEHTVAEYTFALLLALSRKILKVVEVTKQGVVDHSGLTGFDLAGKTIGIIGTGRIGQQVIKIAKGFGMQVLGYDVYPNNTAAEKIGYKYVPLAELLGASDIISLHAPLTADSKHLINTDNIKQLKPGAVIVNTARGELIDTTALLSALRSGQVAGAALDVLEAENLINIEEELLLLRPKASKQSLMLAAEHAILMRMPNVVLSNHNAYNSQEALQRINATTVENIKAFVAGKPVNVISQNDL